MMTRIGIDPHIPLDLWSVLTALVFVAISISIWKRLGGWPWRFLSFMVVLLALLQPYILREQRENLEDIIVVLTDKSNSRTIQKREKQTIMAEQALDEIFASRSNLRVRKVAVVDSDENRGTKMISQLQSVLAEEPTDQIAGVVLITDGEVHDADRDLAIAAPLHVFLTGEKDGFDRRLMVKNAPAFAIVGEPVTMTLRVENLGLEEVVGEKVVVNISIDGGKVKQFQIPLGENVDVKVTLPHAGANIFDLNTDPIDGELTDQNNRTILSINGIRDRLRVLLVTGEPHVGTRTWRNLLKSDSSVDLVHFTILRPPGKHDGVPVNELSLIAFPTRELFLEKIDDFDLIIFDRYKRRGILPSAYLDNIARYVEDGGAVLVSAGPDFATVNSLFRSPLGRILPAEPTSRIISVPYVPKLSEAGSRHPVTAQLPNPETWGRWFRQIEVLPRSGHVLMLGAEDQPLLIVDRVGRGRISLIASDHTWLWDRNFERGGPQLELLRRLAHWMMSEPELEEEALTAEQTSSFIRIVRRTMGDAPKDLTVTSPQGMRQMLTFDQSPDGIGYQAFYESEEQGVFQMQEGDVKGVFALGQATPKEFESPLPNPDRLAGFVKKTNGGTFWLVDGIPDLRTVLPGRVAAGRNWFAITPRGAFDTIDVTKFTVIPSWLVALLAAGFLLVGWLREGGRGKAEW